MIVERCNWSNWNLSRMQELHKTTQFSGQPKWLELEMYTFW